MMYPSGSVLAPALVPTVPPAPGRLSTTTFSPSSSLILSAITRPTIEVEPPGANGMTSVMLRFGKFWACASTCAPGKPNIVAAAQSQIVQIRIFGEPPRGLSFCLSSSKFLLPPTHFQAFSSSPGAKRRSDPSILVWRDGLLGSARTEGYEPTSTRTPAV